MMPWTCGRRTPCSSSLRRSPSSVRAARWRAVSGRAAARRSSSGVIRVIGSQGDRAGRVDREVLPSCWTQRVSGPLRGAESLACAVQANADDDRGQPSTAGISPFGQPLPGHQPQQLLIGRVQLASRGYHGGSGTDLVGRVGRSRRSRLRRELAPCTGLSALSSGRVRPAVISRPATLVPGLGVEDAVIWPVSRQAWAYLGQVRRSC